MKIKSVILAILTICFSLTTPVGAQDSFPMLASVDVLRSYAMEQASVARGHVWSRSILSPGSSFEVSVANQPLDVRLRRLREVVARQSLSFTQANPRDEVFFSVTYENQAGDALFQGTATKRFVQDNGRWVFQNEIPIELSLNYWIPIQATNIEYARVLIKNENGETVGGINIPVDPGTGRFFFPAEWAGTDSLLVLSIRGPHGELMEKIISLRNGQPVDPVEGNGTINVKLDGVREWVLRNEDKMSIEVESRNGFGQSPTISLSVVGPGDPPRDTVVQVNFFAQTTEGELALRAWIRRLEPNGAMHWHPITLRQNEDSTPVLIATGYYHVVFEWPRLKPFPPPIPTDNGKG